MQKCPRRKKKKKKILIKTDTDASLKGGVSMAWLG